MVSAELLNGRHISTSTTAASSCSMHPHRIPPSGRSWQSAVIADPNELNSSREHNGEREGASGAGDGSADCSAPIGVSSNGD